MGRKGGRFPFDLSEPFKNLKIAGLKREMKSLDLQERIVVNRN